MSPALHEALVAYKVHVYRGLAERSRHEARWARQGIAQVAAADAQPGDAVSGGGARRG